MTIKLPNTVKLILDTLNEFGYESFIVGGCVRDSIIGIEPHDWDITTNATPDEVKEVFKKIKKQHRFSVIPTGEKYGTVTVHRFSTKENYEITTYRYDQEYSDGRRPDSVIFGTSINDDLARRDFTMNAIAYNEKDGFIDPYNGQEDIKDKIIRCVGNAEERFNEDALRMLRAVRFACKYHFNIDTAALDAITILYRKVIQNVSQERIQSEFHKILSNSSNNKDLFEIPAIKLLLYKADLLPSKFEKEILWTDFPVNLKMAIIWRNAVSSLLLQKLETEHFSSKDIKKIMCYHTLIGIPYLKNEPEFMKLLFRDYGFDNVYEFCKYTNPSYLLDLEKYGKEPYCIKHLAVDGNDMLKLGFNGAFIGYVLNRLVSYVIKYPHFNTKDYLILKANRIKEEERKYETNC